MLKKLKIGTLVSVDKDACDVRFHNNSLNAGIIIGYESWEMDDGVYADIFQVFVNREVHPFDEFSICSIEE
jgi:hypothetical protein|tara:strand:- start:47 stop:259 length:213 start_codon:yes stop_codon:yes gene_type:complete